MHAGIILSYLKYVLKFARKVITRLQAIILRIYNPKEGNPIWGVFISINFGVLEYWSVGLRLVDPTARRE